MVVSFLANMTTLFSISALVERTPENLAKFSPWLFCGAIIAEGEHAARPEEGKAEIAQPQRTRG